MFEPAFPGRWLDPGPYGCLGTGLGYAIAARLAHPSSQVVLMLGDGAAGLSLMDVDTLVRHNLPVVMIVGNNSAWGLEKGPMQAVYGYDIVTEVFGERGKLVVQAEPKTPLRHYYGSVWAGFSRRVRSLLENGQSRAKAPFGGGAQDFLFFQDRTVQG